MSSELSHLLDMGFPQALAEEALRCTGYNSLDAAMDWLFQHQEEENVASNKVSHRTGEVAATYTKSIPTGHPLKCDDCQKCLQNDEEIQVHSARTGHFSYSELADNVSPLTEEQRKAQMEKLQDIIKQRKQLREEQEKLQELEREKLRRQQGKTIVSAKAHFEASEMRRIAEEKRREKEDDKIYREKLKADIAREREEKKLRDQSELYAPNPNPIVQKSTSMNPAPSVCRLQIRFPNGNSVKAEFASSETLAAIILYICKRWPNATSEVDPTSIQIFTTFPKRDYTDADLQKPLTELDLCPSAVLFVKIKSGSI